MIGFRFLGSLSLVVLMAGFAKAQTFDEVDNDPLVLTEAFVRGRVKPLAQAFTGEAAENPISLDKLPQAPTVKFEQLWRDSSHALVAIEFSNSSSAEDLYTFLDSTAAGWRITAFRAFDLPGVYYMQLNRYRNQGEASIRRDYEAVWERSKSKGVTKEAHEAVHGSIEDRLFYVFNLRLASSSDADLARHFGFLRKQFDALRQNLQARDAKPLPYEHDAEEIGDEMRYLLVKRAYRQEVGPIRFEIASIEGKDVGYFYCADASCMPTPTPGGVIAMRDLGEGWWLYRTM